MVGVLLLLGLVWSLIPPQKPDDSSQADTSNTASTSDDGKSGSTAKVKKTSKATDASSASTPSSATGIAQDLLSSIDLARDVSRDNKSNDWRRENGTLRTVGGRLYLPVENIPDEYDLRLRVERKSAGNALVIGLVSGQRSAVSGAWRSSWMATLHAVACGGWNLSMVKGLPTTEPMRCSET